MLDSGSRKNLVEDDFSNDNLVISTTGVVGDFSVHNEPIVITSTMTYTATQPIDMAMRLTAGLQLYDTVQTCVSVNPVITQATPSPAGYAGVAAYTTQYDSIMPQYIVSAPAHFQAPPMAAATAGPLTAVLHSASMAGTVGAAGTVGTAPPTPMAGSQASVYTGASTLNIQDPPFQGAYYSCIFAKCNTPCLFVLA